MDGYEGDSALDAFLQNSWEKTAELILTEEVWQGKLNRVCIPMV